MSITNPKYGLQVRINANLWHKVKIYAAETRKTMGGVLGEAVLEYFEKRSKDKNVDHHIAEFGVDQPTLNDHYGRD